jgi:hypothetical protein
MCSNTAGIVTNGGGRWDESQWGNGDGGPAETYHRWSERSGQLSGLALGFVGLYQIAAENQPVVITISGTTSKSVPLPVQ